MLKDHLRFIETASDTQLASTRKDLEKLLPTLREASVIRDTRALLRAIDQEALERVMRHHRLHPPPEGDQKAQAA